MVSGIARRDFGFRSVLAVCAHPDDESFGLGAVLSAFTECGISVSVLCFTRGEASTLGASDTDLGTVRAGELAAAAAVLGVSAVRLLAYADGALSETVLEDLCCEVRASVVATTDCMLVLDEGGITGHPDHQRATEAAVVTGRRLGVPVLAWALPHSVAAMLNDEFGAGFVGRQSSEIDLVIEVDRRLQHEAISCHASQATDNPVLRRRLALQGDTEWLRWLSAPPTAS